MAFIPLRITTVKAMRKLNFDLYIYFKDRYLCYVKSGEHITEEKFVKLIEQQVAKFFITEEDADNYQDFIDSLLHDTLSSPNISTDEKIEMVEGSVSNALEGMSKVPPTESSYRLTQTAAKGLRQVINNNPDALKKIFGKKAEKNEELIQHSLNVCALSVKLAEVLNCTNEELENLGTAALLHDIGITHLKKEDMELFYKSKKIFKSEEKRIYYLHARDAITHLKEKPYVNSVILELVLNHEEVLTGYGPNKKQKLTKLEEILSLVNNYDKRLITAKTTPTQTIKEITIDEVGNYSLDLINVFKKVLKNEGMLS
jgi:putative nucleotidyltransferase with HDIG domain